MISKIIRNIIFGNKQSRGKLNFKLLNVYITRAETKSWRTLIVQHVYQHSTTKLNYIPVLEPTKTFLQYNSYGYTYGFTYTEFFILTRNTNSVIRSRNPYLNSCFFGTGVPWIFVKLTLSFCNLFNSTQVTVIYETSLYSSHSPYYSQISIPLRVPKQ